MVPRKGQSTIAPSYAWQNDVMASVYKAWQISPVCRWLVEGAFRA